MIRAFMAAIALSCVAPPAAGQLAPADLLLRRTMIDGALARGDDAGAGQLLDDIVRARQATQSRPAPDPAINLLAGRLMLLRNAPYTAIGYLQAADGGLDEDDRQMRDVALARAYLNTGQLVRVKAVVGRLGKGTAASRVRMELAIAFDPAAAKTIGPPSNDTGPGLDWALLQAAAASLNGDIKSAERATRTLWRRVGRDERATRQASLAAAMLATLAWRRGDTKAQIEFTSSAVRGLDDPDLIVGSMTSGLPACGADVLPDDWLVVAVAKVDGAVRALPLAASRAGSVRPFMLGLDASTIVDADTLADVAIPVLLKCRREPARYGADLRPWQTAWGGWAARTGLYPSFAYYWDGSEPNLAKMRADLATAETRRGKQSAFLFAPLVALIEGVAHRSEDPARVKEAATLSDRLATLDYSSPAGRSALLATAPDLLWLIANVKRADFDARVRAFTTHGDFETSVAMLLMFDDPRASDARATRDILAQRAQTERDPADRARLSLGFFGMENARADKNYPALREFAHQVGLSAAACRSQDTTPRRLASTLTADNYPDTLTNIRFAGKGFVESDIDAAGRVTRSRLIASAPAGLFDRETERGAMQASFSPAIRDGSPVACVAHRDSVTWRPR